MSKQSYPHNISPAESGQEALQQALTRVLKSLVFKTDPSSPLIELPLSQLRCLHAINESPGRKMQDLTPVLHVGLPAVSQIVDRLVRKGLVERRADLNDRRVVRLHLSTFGHSIVAEAKEARQRRMEAVLGRLSASKIDEVTAAFQAIAEAAEYIESREAEAEADGGGSSDPLIALISRRQGRAARTNSVSPEAQKTGPNGRGLGSRRAAGPTEKRPVSAKPR